VNCGREEAPEKRGAATGRCARLRCRPLLSKGRGNLHLLAMLQSTRDAVDMGGAGGITLTHALLPPPAADRTEVEFKRRGGGGKSCVCVSVRARRGSSQKGNMMVLVSHVIIAGCVLARLRLHFTANKVWCMQKPSLALSGLGPYSS